MIKLARIVTACFTLMLLTVACSSSGPATTYYSLFPNPDAAQTQFARKSAQQDISIGIGPVILPDYIDYPSIVGLTETAKVRVYSYHAWAGDLDEAINRVIVENISKHLQLDNIWRFPWDNRVRPDYQLRIVIENYAGIRGENIQLTVKWTLLNKQADRLLLTGKEHLTSTMSATSIDAYVIAMNDALNKASERIAEKIAPVL